MSDSLSALFSKALKLDNNAVMSELKPSGVPDVQESQIKQWLSVCDKLPSSFGELNDALRGNTYLLGGQDVSAVDSVVLGRALPFVAKFSKEETVANRHVVRWADLVQHILKIDQSEQITIDKDAQAPRELKPKPKKETKDAAPASAAAQTSDSGKSSKEAKAQAPKGGDSDGKKEKKEKKDKKEKEPKPAKPAARAISPGMIDLKVGFIEKAVEHPDADSLYVSTINVGEEEPRTICSGLRAFVSLADMQKRYVVVVANLKPVKMRGIVSQGMVLCASTSDHSKVEFVNPPEGSNPGDRLFFEGFDEEPEVQLNPKKKIFEQIQPSFTTLDSLEVSYVKDGQNHKLVNQKGTPLKAASISGASVS